MNWVDRFRTSADEQMLSGRRAVVIAWWAVAGLAVPHWPFVSQWTVTLVIFGIRVLRAHLLGLCCTASFLLIFLQLRKEPSCAELFQSCAFCSSDQCGTMKPLLPAVRELFWGMLGREDGGLRSIGVSGSGYNEVLALEMLNVVWLRRTKETCRASCVCIISSRGRCRAVVPGVLACVHMYILYVCVYTCVCVYVCGHVYVYIYACVYAYVSVCIFVHRLWVSVSVLQLVDGVMHAHVCLCAYVCVCICVSVYIYVHFFAVIVACTLEQVFWALVHGQVCTLHRCVFAPTYTSANTLAAGCVHMCIFIYMCICMHMCMDAYVRLWYCLTRWGVVAEIFYLCIRVHMHACVYVCACMRV